jgi:hypothetical protein
MGDQSVASWQARVHISSCVEFSQQKEDQTQQLANSAEISMAIAKRAGYSPVSDHPNPACTRSHPKGGRTCLHEQEFGSE